jgi:hypothetical protein
MVNLTNVCVVDVWCGREFSLLETFFTRIRLDSVQDIVPTHALLTMASTNGTSTAPRCSHRRIKTPHVT